MKTLLVMRHAKSSWKHSELPDFERPLNKRGRRDAPAMGVLLRDRELMPQHILASPALRVRETVELLADASGYTGEVTWSDQLYLAEPEAILAALAELPDEFERVLLVAHNPGLEMIVQLLSNRIEVLSTGALACFSLHADHWSELKQKLEGDLVEFWKPRDLIWVEVEEIEEVQEEKPKKSAKKAAKKDEKAEKKEEKAEKKSEKKEKKPEKKSKEKKEKKEKRK